MKLENGLKIKKIKIKMEDACTLVELDNENIYIYIYFRRSGTNTSPNSFESRPDFSPLTNYVTTTEQTWLTNMVYVPLM